MAVLDSARKLKNDMLWRAGEPLNGSSQWETKALDYLNRAYRALALGASEFLPEHVEDWWWMYSSSSLVLDPMYDTGSVTVTKGSAAITFSAVYAASVQGWFLRTGDNPDTFVIAAHTAGQATATLDTVYTGNSGSFNYKLMHARYTLPSNVSTLLSPMFVARDDMRINGLAPPRMDRLFPVSRMVGGVPSYFALEDNRTVRFNAAGKTDGTYMRVDYSYKALVNDLTDSDSSIPLVPLEYRHLLSDMALSFLFVDKNDDRSAIAQAARSGLMAMFRENRRKMKMIDDSMGRIYPRASDRFGREPLRTESGLIIG